MITPNEGLGGLETPDVEGIVEPLLFEEGFGLFECGSELGITIAGEDNLPRLEVECKHGDERLGDMESVDDGIGLVLILHDLDHVGNHHLAGWVERLAKLLLGIALSQELAHSGCPHLGQLLFVGLGIIVVFASHQTMTIANEPHLAAHTTIDDGRGGKSLFGMLGHAALGKSQPVMTADGFGDAFAELLTTDIGRHAADISADYLHGIATIAHPGAMATAGLRSGTVDDSDEVICDDDSVLAFLLGVLRNDALLDDFHWGVEVWDLRFEV